MNVAFIPIRGGSKSIPLKNIKLINNKPLVYWTMKAACESRYIDKVFIATDNKEIKNVVENLCKDTDNAFFFKIEIISRSEESATDTAITEIAMLEFAEKNEFDNIILIQATSPLITSKDIDRGFEAFFAEGTDSVLSVVKQKRFQWETDENGFAHPVNYNIFERPRRQDFVGYYVENGAYYISSKNNLLISRNRISGNIKPVELCSDTYFEIDEPGDWEYIEYLLKKRKGNVMPTRIPEIKMFLTDCDGCLTDGGMYYSENGDELKKFNTKDGMAFTLLREKGIISGIITSECVKLNHRRAQKLRADIYIDNCKNKLSVVKNISAQYNIDLKNIAYVGDDINDIEVIQMVGFGCCPNDAIPEIKKISKYITNAKGGEGVIREVVEQIFSNCT